MKIKSGFTLIEILIALGLTSAIFIIATSLVVNIFTSNTKSRHTEALAQVKNDLQAEFSNSVRWADNISYVGGSLQIDSVVYRLENGVLMKNGVPITPAEIEITSFKVQKQLPTSAPPVSSTGSGLTGQYFNTAGLTELVFTQTDYLVDFDWGEGSPDPLIDANTFSIRYLGQVEAPVTSTYTFYVDADEGARLWVDDTLIVDYWAKPGSRSGTISLVGGRKYDIRLEYFENFGEANLSLSWQYLNTPKQIIPTSRLFPNDRSGSVEIVIESRNRAASSVVDTIKLVLSPRSGNIGIIE